MLTKENSRVDWNNIDLAECLEGNAMDAYFTLKIFNLLDAKLDELGLNKLYKQLIEPITTIFLDMEYNGILIDKDELERLKGEMEAFLKSRIEEISKVPGYPKDANLASNDDLIKILYSLKKSEDGKDWILDETSGMGLYPTSRTDKGQPQTNEDTLTDLKALIDQEVVKRGLQIEKDS